MSFQNPPPSAAPVKEPEISIAPLSGLEMTGAICARVIHDLSNLLSGIVGNAEFAQNPEADPASVKKAVQAISVSANAAGKLLGQCLPLQLLVANEAFPYDVSELALIIAEASGLAPGWRVAEPAPLTGQVRVQPRWLTAALWQVARETGAQSGEVEFACGSAVFPVVWHGNGAHSQRPLELFQITLRYRSDHVLVSKDGPANPDRFGLLAACELIRRFKGQIHPRSKPPGRQEAYRSSIPVDMTRARKGAAKGPSGLAGAGAVRYEFRRHKVSVA